MLNTNCGQCLFAKPVSDSDNYTNGCTKNIIAQIKNHKTINQDSEGFNVINNYACRFGFSKAIYEQNKDKFADIDIDAKLIENAKIQYYLLVDCEVDGPDISRILEQIAQLNIAPKQLSLLFRNLDNQNFTDQHKAFMADKLSQTIWKIHNFLEVLDPPEAIDHVLATNLKANSPRYLLVYKSSDLDYLISHINHINDTIVLYQKPHIAMVKDITSIYGLVITAENYNVAKSLDLNIMGALANEESQLLRY